MNKSVLILCSCGRELMVSSEDDIRYCDHCGHPCCDACSHQCENGDHTSNDYGCEKCMIYDKELDKWFCCQECRFDVIDPYGYLQESEGDKQKMATVVVETCKILDKSTDNSGVIQEAKAFLSTGALLYLKGKEQQNEPM